MAVAPSILTVASSATDSQSYTTASVTVPSGAIVYIGIGTAHASSAQSATPSGLSGTWTKMASRSYPANGQRLLEVWKSTDASGTGTISISVAGSSNIGCEWGVVAVTGADATEVRIGTDYTTTAIDPWYPTITALAASGNTLLSWVSGNGNDTMTAAMGHTSNFARSTTKHGTPGALMGVGYDTSIDVTADNINGNTNQYGGVFIELVAIAAALVGVTAGTGATSGALTTQVRLVGATAGVGATSAQLLVPNPLVGATAGTGTTTAALSTAIRLAGAAAGTGADVAALTTAIHLAGSAAGVGHLIDDGVGFDHLAGTAAGTGASVGALTIPIAFIAVTGTSHSLGFARLYPVGAGMPIEVEIWDGGDLTRKLAILEGARQRRWYDPLNDVGAFSFLLPSGDPKATDEIIADGNLVVMKLHGQPQFAAFIEGDPGRVSASINGQSGEYFTVQGKGAVGLLARAIVDPVDAGTFTMSAAGILAQYIAAAQARGTIPALGYDFTATVDSAGTPWTDSAAYTIAAGTKLDDLWRQAIAVGIEFRVTPDLVLHAYADGLGTHRESTVVLRQGYHLRTALERPKSTPTPTRVVVKGASGVLVRVIGNESDVRKGRWEEYLEVSTTSEPSTLVLAGQQFLSSRLASAQALTVPLHHGLEWGQYEAYLDYSGGDWIALNVPNQYDRVSQRIAALTIEETAAGGYLPTLDLSSVQLEYATRLQRQIDAITSEAFTGS